MYVTVEKDLLEDVLDALGSARDYFYGIDTANSILTQDVGGLVVLSKLTKNCDTQVERLSALLTPEDHNE